MRQSPAFGPSGPGGEGGRTSRFPVTDSEPPPRSRRRLLLVTATGLCIAGAAIAAGVWWPSDTSSVAPSAGPKSSGSRLHPTGRLLVSDTAGSLGYTNPEGGHHTNLRGATASYGGVPSPNQDIVLTRDGALIRMYGGDAVTSSVIPPGQEGRLRPAFRPWADHGRHVILLSAGGGHAEVVSATITGRDVVSLGDGAVDAVGDPRQNAALVVVAGRHLFGHGQDAELPGIRLEHRRNGDRAVVATTSRLARTLGFPDHAAYSVSAAYAPGGRRIAVILSQLTPGHERHGLVVLTRGGTPVFHRAGPAGYAWSHDGGHLAYWTLSGSRVRVLDPHGHGRRRVQDLPLPMGATVAEPCLWSPRDDLLLCDELDDRTRVLLEVGTGRTERFELDGPRLVVLAWLPAQGAS